MRKRILPISFFLLLASSHFGQSRSEFKGPLFPIGREGAFTDPSNPAFPARSKAFTIGSGASDRALLPELAFQSLWATFPMEKGCFQLYGDHYGNENYREGSIRIGYALPIGASSSMGVRVGGGRVWIGEGHGQRFFWKLRSGVRSRTGDGLIWEFWISDPHASLRNGLQRELLHPSIVLGGGKRWSSGDRWTLHLSKELGRPLSFQTHSRIGILGRFHLITGLQGLPLAPLFGWSLTQDRFRISLASSWRPALGFTPTCRILYSSEK